MHVRCKTRWQSLAKTAAERTENSEQMSGTRREKLRKCNTHVAVLEKHCMPWERAIESEVNSPQAFENLDDSRFVAGRTVVYVLTNKYFLPFESFDETPAASLPLKESSGRATGVRGRWKFPLLRSLALRTDASPWQRRTGFTPLSTESASNEQREMNPGYRLTQSNRLVETAVAASFIEPRHLTLSCTFQNSPSG